MIEIKTRKYSKYVNVEIDIDGFKKDFGLFDDEERQSLISTLEEAVEELKSYDE